MSTLTRLDYVSSTLRTSLLPSTRRNQDIIRGTLDGFDHKYVCLAALEGCNVVTRYSRGCDDIVFALHVLRRVSNVTFCFRSFAHCVAV